MTTGNTYGGTFCAPDERQITTIGTGYIANYLSGGGATQEGATLTNKRIYFSGKIYEIGSNRRLSSIKTRKIVNVRDVTGVGYVQYNPIFYLVIATIVFAVGFLLGTTFIGEIIFGGSTIGLGALVAVYLIWEYFANRKTLMSIEYAGGNIGFEVRWQQSSEDDDFIRNIHLAKDKLYSTAAVAQGFAPNPTAVTTTNASSASPSFCPFCGGGMKPGDLFCKDCGKAPKAMSGHVSTDDIPDL